MIRSRFVLLIGVFLVSAVAEKRPCTPALRSFTVANTGDASKLSDALNCTGGEFSVEWHGHVYVNKTIAVGTDTSLTVTGGENSGAVVDGGGTTQLFNVSGGELHLSNLQLSNGFAGDGGAVFLLAGNMSWTGPVSFTGNVAEIDGGAIRCLLGNVEGVGQATFFNNSAGEDAGAIRVEGGTMSAVGNTTFISNAAERSGGALFATHDASVKFVGNTCAEGHSAEYGGAFAIGWEGTIGSAALSLKGTSVFEGNNASSQGGAWWVSEGCDVSSEGFIRFAENSAAGDGGAVTIYSDSVLNIEVNATGGGGFYRNEAVKAGGAVYSTGYSQTQTYVNVAFDDNMAGAGGQSLSK